MTPSTGPWVNAARQALEADDVEMVLPFVPRDGEGEITDAFHLVRKARAHGAEAREVADLYFFDTVVRVHRRGEGAAHTGLKPAGLDTGPVIPLAERAVDAGDASELVAFLQAAVRDQAEQRIDEVRTLRRDASAGVAAARAYTSARLGFLVWSHKLWNATKSQGHG